MGTPKTPVYRMYLQQPERGYSPPSGKQTYIGFSFLRPQYQFFLFSASVILRDQWHHYGSEHVRNTNSQVPSPKSLYIRNCRGEAQQSVYFFNVVLVILMYAQNHLAKFLLINYNCFQTQLHIRISVKKKSMFLPNLYWIKILMVKGIMIRNKSKILSLKAYFW